MKKIIYQVKISFIDEKSRNVEVTVYASTEKDLLEKVSKIVDSSPKKFLWLFNRK